MFMNGLRAEEESEGRQRDKGMAGVRKGAERGGERGEPVRVER